MTVVFKPSRSVIKHYGTPRHSGRYPWGSGEDPYQGDYMILERSSQLKKTGMSEVEIAKALGLSTTDLRLQKAIQKDAKRAADVAQALKLKEHGWSNSEIGRKMGRNESSIRQLLSENTKEKANIQSNVVTALKDGVDKRDMIDVGPGSELYLGVSRGTLKKAVGQLKEEGYTVHNVQIKQPFSPNKYTNVQTLAKPGTTIRDAYLNRENISTIGSYSEDYGRNILGIEDPKSVNSSRVKIKYAEQGGIDKDGMIELRPGVADLDLRGSRYAQVRIEVDSTHYIKGMAVYNPDLPKGVDILFNTNKKEGMPMMSNDKDNSVLKPIKGDPENPFGSIVRQYKYKDSNGNEQLSALNIVGSKEGAGEEGYVGQWSKNLSSQVLSKQTKSLAERQLTIARESMESEYDNIMSLTNPVVKQRLLYSLAESADSASVHLKAAALPRQMSHLILSIPEMKEDQIYAPNYENGTRVVLIRHPHAGPFEIPELTVNNRASKHNEFMRNAADAVGIHPNVAKILSGADFDGDTVIVIPNNNRNIKTSEPLKGLENFDPQERYPGYPGMKTITLTYKENQMGVVSNLITDMTIRGAKEEEIVRAVRHSMVIIDAEKHNLNYKQSYIDNGIGELKQKYQKGSRGGASTLISRAGSTVRIEDVKRTKIDPNTGKLINELSGKTYVNKKGETVKSIQKVELMSITDDPYKLSSGTQMENVYAEYAIRLKQLADKARLEASKTPNMEYNPSARQVYAKEVESLEAKMRVATRNKPLERRAQILSDVRIAAKRKDNPDMDAKELKKIKTQVVTEARLQVGAKKIGIDITPKEWDAIQAGAVSSSRLRTILNNVEDLDQIKEYATPKSLSKKGLSAAQISRAKARLNAGYTQAEVAKLLGISPSTLSKALE